MNSLLKSVTPLTNKKNILVRESLQKQLNTSVVEMQSAPGVAEEKPVGNCEEAMSLCSVLEAIFLHGLKNSLLNRVTEVLSGPDFDAMPQPSFWGPLLVFSHRQIIDQIQALTQVTTEVGYCRAWIRLALNEGLLASYLCSIRRDNSALKPYYDRSAFIRDTDLVEVTQRSIESLEYIRFELACNTSLLNFWSSTPLLLAGIWSQPMKSSPVISAVDIAKTITTEVQNDNLEEIETASSIGSLGSFNSSQSALNNLACLSEDDVLKLILKDKVSNNHAKQCTNDSPTHMLKQRKIEKENEENVEVDKSNNTNASVNGTPKKDIKTVTTDNETVTSDTETTVIQNDLHNNSNVFNDNVPTTVGNSLFGRLGWSTSFEDCESSKTSSVISHASGTDAPHTPGDGPSYDALIQSYYPAGNVAVPDLQEVLKKYPKKESSEEEAKPSTVIKNVINFDDQLGKLPREKGLDTQNYSCFDCGQSIGMKCSKAYVCSFSANYYCANCMAQEEYVIPSRMIHNWDLKRYAICQKAAEYLKESPALLDLNILNPKIYMAVDVMAQLQSLRIQLNLLRAYLFTCREPIIESLQRKVTPRDYLYEHVHQYSVSDLLDIPNGILAQQLQKVVQFARNHVISCWLCSQKGFFCEMCNNPKVIYPFDMDSTYRCGLCNAVFHANCLNAYKPCPKCERRRKRMDLPLLDMGCTELPPESILPCENNVD